jgi:hypothetical protein
MKRILIGLCILILSGCASMDRLEDTGGSTGLGVSPFSSGSTFTASDANAMNDAINDNATDITAAEAAIDALEAYFSSDLLLHENGGLEADVSAYDGILAITGGATYELNTTIELEDAANLGAYASNILDATDEADFKSIINLNEDKIEEGDTSVETVDAGTGQVDIDVDGEKQVGITDGYVEVVNGLAFRVITTTDGHTTKFQVYDSNGTTWRDALTFENGASDNADATNWPRVHLGSNVALTGLGAMAVSDVWGAEQTGANTIIQSEMNQWYLVTAACTMTMEDVASTISEGSKIGFRIRDAAETLTIDVDGTEKLVIDGTALAAGTAIECSGVGTEIILRAYDDVDGSGNEGYFVSYNGTCASE